VKSRLPVPAAGGYAPAPMRDLLRRTPSLRHWVLMLAVVAFAVSAALGPYGTLCFCFGERADPVAIGCCCNEHKAPAAPPTEKDAAGSMRGDEACPCVDLKGADQPAAPDRVPDPLPPPAWAATTPLAVESVESARTCSDVQVRPPPRPHPFALRSALRV
jgi:hypothetical protein